LQPKESVTFAGDPGEGLKPGAGPAAGASLPCDASEPPCPDPNPR